MYGISPKLPLLVDDLDGHYGLTKTLKEAIKQNFKNLMLTSPGERVMDKDFGVGLRHYLFENFTMELGDRIEFNIYQQTKKYLSFIKITHVDIKQAEDALSTLNIRIEYTIPKLGTNDVLILNQTN
jgi:phage baseplate assembly protein W